jgi:hypothetical protein
MTMIFKYLKYLIRHKYYVAKFCFKSGLYWQGVVHDLSKFRPDEFFPYARYFYGDKEFYKWADEKGKYIGYYGRGLRQVEEEFLEAWLKHQNRNPHHWQYWLLHMDNGSLIKMPMPQHYMLEMICDWRGAGMAITGEDNTLAWYNQNKENINLHHWTQGSVEIILNEPS